MSTIDATGRVPVGERALVLHGGGSAGNAWEIGVVAGLLEAGLDVREADLVVGTSAGATAAVQILTVDPAELLEAALAAPPPSVSAGTGAARPVVDQLERTGRIIAAASDPADMRRRVGAAALELDAASGDSWTARWRGITAARLPRQDWPDRPLLITAVDARTGLPVVFDRQSGVPIVDAVAASTASGAPYRIGDDRYLDGGYRRNENADLAAGCARVLVLSPYGGRSRHPASWGMQLSAQIDELRASGSRVEAVFPAEDVAHLFGADAMDPASRPPAARAGAEQGRALAAGLAGLWR